MYLYLGKIAEMGRKNEIFNNPKHPYTRALLSAVPVPDPKHKPKRMIPKGEIPSPINPPSGCYFHPRCPIATGKCSEEEPKLVLKGRTHYVACHYALGKATRIMVGFRPQHVEVKLPKEKGFSKGMLLGIERLGTEMFGHLLDGDKEVILMLPPDLEVNSGDTVYWAPKSDKMYFFDAETQKAIKTNA